MFKSNGSYQLAHARAPDVMSTQSEVGFEWTLKLMGGDETSFYVGIASMLKPEHSRICSYDENSILYCSYNKDIRLGSNTMHSNLPNHKYGDVIRFRLQPKRKRLLIDLVRKNKSKLKNF